jgi:N-methylhydantoinase B
MSTLMFWRKQYRSGSGGPGMSRGGLGQHIEFGNSPDEPFTCITAFERVRFPARGFFDGHSGALDYVGLSSGQTLPGKGRHLVPKGDRIVILSPDGGGLGDPRKRDPAPVRQDVEYELVSEATARDVHGLAQAEERAAAAE